MNGGTINPVFLILTTIVLFVPIYLALIGGVYMVRRYLPDARGFLDSTIEPILFFPAAACAFLLALTFGPR